ncbi:hypothetical protein CVV68_12590 [Arthrobacter livingstonensis]|uniref:Uncharacterized protein n=1 Tax=Arthrobacter livingstonensis TaxID=670078 RepID=A0A2V5L692_9MICC|nr:hypothetical protein [Arthrobacter livingstonensis]PYI66925.1 hypothetical protein CVV68_12590 [Arthrobacter livingstonensis]
MDTHGTKDSSQDGTIVNPGKDEGRDTSVGDEGDNANELRFDEEDRLIKEQSLRPEEEDRLIKEQSLRQEEEDRLTGEQPLRPEAD